MKKILIYDLKRGLLKNKLLFFMPIIIGVAMGVSSFIDNMNSYRLTGKMPYIGDIYFYIFGGMKKYVPSPTNQFIFPTLWIIIFLTPLLLTIIYPFSDLNGQGSNNLVNLGSRKLWWSSKIIWCILYNVYYYSIILIAFLFLLLTGKVINEFSIDEEKMIIFFNLDENSVLHNTKNISPLIFFFPLVLLITLGIIQLAFTFIFKPYIAFICTSIILLLSAYYYNEMAFGNLGMLIRQGLFFRGGLDYKISLIICLVIIIGFYFAGEYRLRKMDILGES